MRRTRDEKGFDNIESGSWLVWTTDTTAQYAVIHCWRWRPIGSTVCN